MSTHAKDIATQLRETTDPAERLKLYESWFTRSEWNKELRDRLSAAMQPIEKWP